MVAVLALAAGTAGVVVGAGHDGDESDTASEVPSPGRGAPEERVSFLARIVPPPAQRQRGGRGPAVPRSVADLARRLPVERKVAQLFLFGFRGTDLTSEIFGRLRRLDLGGIVIASQNYTDATQLGGLAGEAAVIAREERHVPPWVMTSQEGGELNSFPDLPPASLPADMGSAEEAAAAAGDSAATLRGLGVNGVLGPVVDVGQETGSALGARLYSDDAEEVAAYADATVSAYRAKHVFSSVKHFPGLGAADQSTEEGPATVGLGLDELRERDLIPFEAAVDAGVPGVVISHALYPFSDFTVPASLSKSVATGLLRRRAALQGRGAHGRPRRPGHHDDPHRAGRGRAARCASAPTCSTSPAERATSRRPTWRCCERSSAAASRDVASTRPWAESCSRSRTTTCIR